MKPVCEFARRRALRPDRRGGGSAVRALAGSQGSVPTLEGSAGAEIGLESPVKVDRFVGKPYQPTGLADLVQRVLSEAA